jgi:hypothetical protein
LPPRSGEAGGARDALGDVEEEPVQAEKPVPRVENFQLERLEARQCLGD